MREKLEHMNFKQIEALAYFTKKHRRTLAKIHKIKRENRVLSSRRKRLLSLYPDTLSYYVCILSERIGANGNRIQRLRTKLSQMKRQYDNDVRSHDATWHT